MFFGLIFGWNIIYIILYKPSFYHTEKIYNYNSEIPLHTIHTTYHIITYYENVKKPTEKTGVVRLYSQQKKRINSQFIKISVYRTQTAFYTYTLYFYTVQSTNCNTW